MKSKTKIIGGMFFAAALATAGAAIAEETPSLAPSPAPVSEDEVVSLEDLEALAGGDGVTLAAITEQQLTAINAGNSVNGQVVNSGDINLAAGALASFNGVGNFVMNTGHNNNLQSSMNVSIVMAP